MYIVPPQVTTEPHQFVLRGNNATLRCNVTGDPEPVVLWIRNGQRINPDENTRYSEPQLGLLKFTNTTPDDAGVYECRASNAKGNDMTNITLTVLSKCTEAVFLPMQCMYIHVCSCACLHAHMR